MLEEEESRRGSVVEKVMTGKNWKETDRTPLAETLGCMGFCHSDTHACIHTTQHNATEDYTT